MLIMSTMLVKLCTAEKERFGMNGWKRILCGGIFFRWVEIEISRQSKYGMGFIMMMIIIEFYKWFILKVGSAS